MKVNAFTDTGTEHPQDDIDQKGTLDKPPGDLPDSMHHQPDSEATKRPDACIASGVASDDQPFYKNRAKHKCGCPESGGCQTKKWNSKQEHCRWEFGCGKRKGCKPGGAKRGENQLGKKNHSLKE